MVQYQEIEKMDYESILEKNEQIKVLSIGKYQIIFGKDEKLYYMKPKHIKNNSLFKEVYDYFRFTNDNDDIHLFEQNVFHKALFFCFMRIKKDLKDRKDSLSLEEKKLIVLLDFILSDMYDSKKFLMIEIKRNHYIFLKNKDNNVQYIYYLNLNKKDKFIHYENRVKNENLNKENIFKFLTKEESYFDLKLILELM